MTPADVEADRKGGTPGPWFIGKNAIGPKGEFGFLRHVVDMNWDDDQGKADARRIARVPDLEDAYLAHTARIAALEARVKELEAGLQNRHAYRVGYAVGRAWHEDVRQWHHYPIEMPLNGDGQGPAKIGVDAKSMTYEVWDQLLNTHSSHDNLPDAINEAMRLNRTLLGDKP